MKRSTHWLVADHGIRPAGPPDRCFYCGEPQGKEHAEGCVIRSRTVVVQVQVEMVVNVPEDWDADKIEFSFNESSSCGDNLISRVIDLQDRLSDDGRCMCGVVRAEFLREATEEDEQAQLLRVNDLPN